MPNTQREIAETVFERNQRREKEINDALKQEHARREAAVKNMFRLRTALGARYKKEIAHRKISFIARNVTLVSDGRNGNDRNYPHR
jgi:hypothetical protein